MKILISIKTTLRGMLASGAITLGYFIGFPVLLAMFMSFIQGSLTEENLTLSKASIVIVDEDKSEMSKNLIDFLNSSAVENIIKIEEQPNKDTAEIVIKEGYGEQLMAQNKSAIIINAKEELEKNSLEVLKIILDNYHQSIYLSLSGENNENLNSSLQETAVKSSNIFVKDQDNSKGIYVVSMLEFVITMLLFNFIQGAYIQIAKNMDNRVRTTPMSNNEVYFCDFACNFVYTAVIVGAYVFFFMATGISFKGNVLSLLILVLMAALFISSLGLFVTRVFGEKLGKVVGSIMFILPIIGMKMFTGAGNIMANLAPTAYVVKAFETYSIGGVALGQNKYLLMVSGISIILILITLIKINYKKRRPIKCA